MARVRRVRAWIGRRRIEAERRRKERYRRKLEWLERQREKLERERTLLEKRAPVEELKTRIRKAKGPSVKSRAWKWLSTPPPQPAAKPQPRVIGGFEQPPARPTPAVPEHRPVASMRFEMERLERAFGVGKKKERR